MRFSYKTFVQLTVFSIQRNFNLWKEKDLHRRLSVAKKLQDTTTLCLQKGRIKSDQDFTATKPRKWEFYKLKDDKSLSKLIPKTWYRLEDFVFFLKIKTSLKSLQHLSF